MTAAPPDTRMSAARSWRAVGVLGEILITFGVLLLLFVAYQLWWTNVTATRAADSAASQLRDSWAQPAPGDGRSPDDQYQEPDLGQAFALMYIPRLSDKVWGTPVVEGVQAADLAQGIGHYPGTAMPGEVGNFAVAASYNQASQANLRRRGASIGGTATFGATSVTLDLTRDTKNEWTGKKYTNGVVEAKYALSKRTFVYGAFLRYDGDNNYGIGVRHNF